MNLYLSLYQVSYSIENPLSTQPFQLSLGAWATKQLRGPSPLCLPSHRNHLEQVACLMGCSLFKTLTSSWPPVLSPFKNYFYYSPQISSSFSFSFLLLTLLSPMLLFTGVTPGPYYCIYNGVVTSLFITTLTPLSFLS